jgi:hypothetical protein
MSALFPKVAAPSNAKPVSWPDARGFMNVSNMNQQTRKPVKQPEQLRAIDLEGHMGTDFTN